MAATTVELAQTGEYLGHHQRPFSLARVHLEQMARNAEGAPIVIDYEHATQLADLGTEVPAAGWISRVWVDDDTLYGEVEWTDRAATMIDNDEYRFLSPVIDLDAVHPNTGEPIGAVLISVGLTNVPFIQGMEPVTNSQTASTGAGHALCTLSPTSTQALRNSTARSSDSSEPTDTAMPDDTRSTLTALKRKLKGIFNSASDDELDLLDEARQAKQRADKLDTAKEELEEQLSEAQEQIDTLTEKLSEAEATQQEQQQEQDQALLNSAVEKGKIKKADRDDWAERLEDNREATRALLNSIPSGTVMPDQGNSPDPPSGSGSDDDTPSDPYAAHVAKYASS